MIPFASRFERVTGVDVARAMLDEARRNCNGAGVENVELLETAQFLAQPDGFDLVHSVLVFQHIRPHQGLPLNVLSRVAPGGVAAMQFVFGRDGLPSPLRRLQARMPFVARLSHRVEGRP